MRRQQCTENLFMRCEYVYRYYTYGYTNGDGDILILALHLQLCHPLLPQLLVEPVDELLRQAVDLVPHSGLRGALRRARQHLPRLPSADAGRQTSPTAVAFRRSSRGGRARELVATAEVVAVGGGMRDGAGAGEPFPEPPALGHDCQEDCNHGLLGRHEQEHVSCAVR